VGLNRFYDRLLDMLKEPGLLLGPATADPQRVAEALDDLAAGERLLGDNQEATMWRGVLLARAGRTEDAGAALRDAVTRRPELASYLRQMASAGDLPAEALPAP
jgi:Flp pilus assembly protein TadD